MIRAILILTLVLFATTGCKNTVDEITEDTVKTPKTVAVFDAIPDTLSDLPAYPESPENIKVKEYDNGYEVEMVVPNPHAVARAAWITAFQEKLWQVKNEVVITKNNFSWVTMKKGDALIFIKMQNSGDEQTTLTTFIKK